MNYLFAHNGIDHSNPAEATAHQASDVLPAVLIVSAVVAVGIIIAVLAIRRLAPQPSKKEGEE